MSPRSSAGAGISTPAGHGLGGGWEGAGSEPAGEGGPGGAGLDQSHPVSEPPSPSCELGRVALGFGPSSGHKGQALGDQVRPQVAGRGATESAGRPQGRACARPPREQEREARRSGARGGRAAGRQPGHALGRDDPGSPTLPGASAHVPAGSPAPGCAAALSRLCPRRYFFTTVASASAALLYMIVILLYTLIQYFINPASLRTDPHYRSMRSPRPGLGLPSRHLPSGGPRRAARGRAPVQTELWGEDA